MAKIQQLFNGRSKSVVYLSMYGLKIQLRWRHLGISLHVFCFLNYTAMCFYFATFRVWKSSNEYTRCSWLTDGLIVMLILLYFHIWCVLPSGAGLVYCFEFWIVHVYVDVTRKY
jgi:hypothetical protein